MRDVYILVNLLLLSFYIDCILLSFKFIASHKIIYAACFALEPFYALVKHEMLILHLNEQNLYLSINIIVIN